MPNTKRKNKRQDLHESERGGMKNTAKENRRANKQNKRRTPASEALEL